jgi:glycosyltransferase involved in cell wall biosynthesis
MESYVRNLLGELEHLDRRHHYVLVTSPDNEHLFAPRSRRWKKVTYVGHESAPESFAVLPEPMPDPRPTPRRFRDWWRPRRRRSWSQGLSDLIRHERLDLWFCPLMYMLPVDVAIPVVATIPDLQHEHFREFFPPVELARRALGYQYTCQRAAVIIGISEFVARDLVARYGLDPHRTVAIPLALDPSFAVTPSARAQLIDEVRLKYGLDHNFIYYPANGWRHKNHEALVRALRIVRRKGRDLRVVLTGCEFDVAERMGSLFENREEADAVRHLGYVSRRDTIGLYAAATLMVFPSLFEGFGLPLLEAMQCETPVICLPVGSVPEVGGDAVLYADPPDETGIAEAVLRLLDDDGLRRQLVAAGRARVRQFSYRETARRTLAIFEAVLAGTFVPPGLPPGRPLIAHHWLREGHSRWYFRCEDLRAVTLTIAQPTRLPELADQQVTVSLNEEIVLETVIEPERSYPLTFTARSGSLRDLHRLDVRASAVTRFQGQTLSVQVRALTMVRGDGTELSLIG